MLFTIVEYFKVYYFKCIISKPTTLRDKTILFLLLKYGCCIVRLESLKTYETSNVVLFSLENKQIIIKYYAKML